MCLAEIIYSK